MSFLNPMAIAVALGVTVPALVALYFLKLKRSVYRVPSTLLWKRAVEDLQVNSPFQRLRGSLLLLLQLLVLILVAFALGKPMLQQAGTHESTIIILVDQSASMDVLEADGQTRLEKAKEQARICVDNMSNDARAMVIAFCDRATVVSSFDTDKHALKRKIDSIEQTQSTSSLSEAISLAEAHTQNITIGSEEAGRDLAPESAAPPVTVFVITDGRIEGADRVATQEFNFHQGDKILMLNVGVRKDNVGIVTMDARRSYERPEILEVTAAIRNFGAEPVTLDVVLYVEGQNVDVQSLEVRPAPPAESGAGDGLSEPTAEDVAVAAFDAIEFGGGGVVEVVLRVDDALAADNRAWTIVEEPRHVRVLLVTEGEHFLHEALAALPVELVTMTPAEYEAAEENEIQHGDRSAFDVVMMDRHSPARLPHGDYLFWGAVPQLEGVAAGGVIDDEVLVNWDETHPLLRHVAVENLFVFEWLRLTVPPEAVHVMDGETSPVMVHLARDASQFLISAFSVTLQDDLGRTLFNTYWVTSVDFIVFMQNAVQFLASNVAMQGMATIGPGEPVTIPIPERVQEAAVIRPDGTRDDVPTAGFQTVHYARTRIVGVYRIEPGTSGRDRFAVNLFNAVESHVEPAPVLMLGADRVEGRAGTIEVNRPAWRYLVIAVLALLLLEWIVYNQRVFV